MLWGATWVPMAAIALASLCGCAGAAEPGKAADAAADSIVIYVDASADSDAADGTAARPFASIRPAQRALRERLSEARRKRSVSGATEPPAATVRVAAGHYFDSSTVFTDADSGPPGGRVVWRGEPGAVVYGGKRVTGWNRTSLRSGRVWAAPLGADLVDGEGRGLFTTLVQGNRSAVLARAPDFGGGYLPCSGDPVLRCPAGALPAGVDCSVTGAAGSLNASSACSVFVRAGYSSDIRAVVGVSIDGSGAATITTSTAGGVDAGRGSVYLQGALELLDAEGEWAVRNSMLYFWPHATDGVAPTSLDTTVVTAPVVQRVLSFVGASADSPVSRITVAGLAVVGGAMPKTYVYACHGSQGGAGAANCAADGGPDTPDQTNTSPHSASQGMVYLENATDIAIINCSISAGGVAGVWMQEHNIGHTVAGNWVHEMGGFGLYSNGVGVGDRRFSTPDKADCNRGHTIRDNVFSDGGRQIEYGSGVWLFQTGETVISHNVIHRFPRDGVGFYGMLPFFTTVPGGSVAPGMPAAANSSAERFPWGRFVSWNANASSNAAWTPWDVLFARDNVLEYNDIGCCNRQGLDGGVIESWGVSRNCTWAFNAVHDSEGYGGLSVMFADDFSPGLTVKQNIIFENNCPIVNGANCAVFMLKSVNSSAWGNVVGDGNMSRVFEVAAYRMPAANINVSQTILWNSTQRTRGGESCPLCSAYAASCLAPSMGPHGNTTVQTATLGSLLADGDGTGSQRSRMAQYGFSPQQLAWPVVAMANDNFASDLEYLRGANCSKWDTRSIALSARPFAAAPGGVRRPWFLRTHLDYGIAPDSPLVTQHGFAGSFDVAQIGLTSASPWVDAVSRGQHKRVDAFGRVQAERYDRTHNLWTLEAHALGSGGPTHFQKESPYAVPPGSWARFDAVDFGSLGGRVSVVAAAAGVADGARVHIRLGSPDTTAPLLATLELLSGAANSGRFALVNGPSGTDDAPAGVHTVFIVFNEPAAPSPAPNDKPHRFWRVTAGPSDFNNSFYNTLWHVCELELRESPWPHGPNLATDPTRAVQSSGNGSKAFDGMSNCTQWDGCMGCKSDMWTPESKWHDHQWVGYDFGSGSPRAIKEIRLKQFPNQYCAATPQLQYSDNISVQRAVRQIWIAFAMYLVWYHFERPWDVYGCRLPTALGVMGSFAIKVAFTIFALAVPSTERAVAPIARTET